MTRLKVQQALEAFPPDSDVEVLSVRDDGSWETMQTIGWDVLSRHGAVDERCGLLDTSTALRSIPGPCRWSQAHLAWTVHTTPVVWRVGLSLERTRRGRAVDQAVCRASPPGCRHRADRR
jgi:hypothetical protein